MDDNARIAADVAAQGPRLRAFVRRQVADLAEVEDIVQDTFAQLVASYRLTEPIVHVAAWLRRVARNRIIDRFRRRAHESLSIDELALESTAVLDAWAAPAASDPEASYVREVLAEELAAALAELPVEQRAVFIAHELEGRSFKALATESGVGLNTLLSRKHAAVRHLRQRLSDIHSELD
jgi:RNA polymerase sigma factor (sigma-70 family)